MPKGQSPKTRMDARRSLLNKKVDRQSGIRLPKAGYESDASPIKKLMGKAINKLSDARSKQMQSQGGEEYQKNVKALNKIDDNRDREAERASRAELRMKKTTGDELMFAKGGMVKAQVSGKGFKGTF